MYPGDKHQHTNCSVNVPHLPHSMNVLRPEQTYPPNEPVAEKFPKKSNVITHSFHSYNITRRCMRGFVSLCMKYASGIFAQGCLYLCVFLRQQKH